MATPTTDIVLAKTLEREFDDAKSMEDDVKLGQNGVQREHTDAQGGSLTLAELARHRGKPTQATSNLFSIFAGAFAFVTDGYQNSLLSTSNLVFRKIYGPNVYNAHWSTQISNALLVGTILGQITVGLITDRVGRRTAILFTTLFILVGGILGTVAHAPTPEGLFWFLTVARGTVGVGAGGEYPASSAQTSEGVNAVTRKHRGSIFTAFVNGSLTFGSVLTICVMLLGVGASKYDDSRDPAQLHKLEITWRCEWAVGVILPLTVLYFRLKLLDSASFQKHALKSRPPYKLFFKRYWPRLIGTMGTWWLNQFVGYSNGVFSGLVIASVIPQATLKTTGCWLLLLSAFNFPATFLSAWVSDKMNRKHQMMIGFGGQAVFGIIVFAAFDKITKIPALFVILYALFLSIGIFGPGNLNGIILVESYPTAFRGTAYGMTAAFGKMGGLCGTYAFLPIVNNLGKKYTFLVGGCLGFLGVALTQFFLVNKLGHDFSEEDEDFDRYLDAKGYTGPRGTQGEGSVPTSA